MQIFNSWPDENLLVLQDNVKVALIKHLIKPFLSLEEAKAYWLENKPLVIFLEKQDTSESIARLDPLLQRKITMVLTYPEYTEEIAMGYTIKLAIYDDVGDGIYCLQNSLL